LAFGAFNYCLSETYKILYNKDLKITYYGKPNVKSFEYAKQRLHSIYNTSKIKRFYMIGDNPNSDI